MNRLRHLAAALAVLLPAPAFGAESAATDMAGSGAAQMAAVAAADPLLGTQTTAAYRFRNPRLSQAGSRLEGWADNELNLAGQLRAGHWLYGGEVWRYKAAGAMPGLRADQNPVMTPEVTDFRLRAGRVVGGEYWEAAPSLTYLQSNVTPNNQGVPYSGTLMDWTHVRRGLGLTVPATLALPGSWELGGAITALPWSEIRLEKAPEGVGASWFAEVRVAVSRALREDLLAEVSYTRSLWRGGFDEDVDVYGVGLRYRPALD